ncbi:MAG: S1C family serine protease [Clostridia bacterium]
MTKKHLKNNENDIEVINDAMAEDTNHGCYTETIKKQKKSFVERILVPFFVCLLCLALSICACAFTVAYVFNRNLTSALMQVFNVSSLDVGLKNSETPSPSDTEGYVNTHQDQGDTTDSGNISTIYQPMVKIEVIPYEVNSSISDATEKVMPSIAYLVCKYSDGENTYEKKSSALIISDDGYIVTCDTALRDLCIDNSNELKPDCSVEVSVNYDYSKVYSAVVVGRDQKNNIALLKIECDLVLKFIEYGDSDALKMGETVLSASNGGNASSGIVTAGIVSGLVTTYNDKAVEPNTKISDELWYISTTAPMCDSCNGGALVNIYGQVVGMTIFGNDPVSGDSESIYYAIPVNKIMNIAEDLESNTFMNDMTPNIGIAVLTDPVKISLTENQTAIDLTGLKVKYVGFNTPAYDSGLKVDDVIVSIYDETLAIVADFFRIKNNYNPGESILLIVYRYYEGELAFKLVPIQIILSVTK